MIPCSESIPPGWSTVRYPQMMLRDNRDKPPHFPPVGLVRSCSLLAGHLQPPSLLIRGIGYCRSNISPRGPSWSVAHLTRLTTLSLRGESAHRVMDALLASPAAAVLPASLRTLRQDSPDAICFSAEGRRVKHVIDMMQTCLRDSCRRAYHMLAVENTVPDACRVLASKAPLCRRVTQSGLDFSSQVYPNTLESLT